MFSFALKNILFYRGRSITTFILTFISTILFIVYVSMMDGSHDSMLKNSLKIYGGAIEIYYKDYRDIGGNEYLIRDVDSIKKKLSNIDGIELFSSRYETYGLLSHKDFSTASMVVGIESKKEEILSQLKNALIGALRTSVSAATAFRTCSLLPPTKCKYSCFEFNNADLLNVIR